MVKLVTGWVTPSFANYGLYTSLYLITILKRNVKRKFAFVETERR